MKGFKMSQKKPKKFKDPRGRPKVSSKEKLAIARRLRIEEKKTLKEIAEIVGVSKSSVQRWSKEENWPKPHEEVREFKGIFKVKEKTKLPKPKFEDTGTLQDFLPEGMPEVDFDGSVDQMIEDLLRWCCKGIHHSAKFNTKAQIELAKIVAKVWLGKKEKGEQRDLTVFIPKQEESYRGKPEDG